MRWRMLGSGWLPCRCTATVHGFQLYRFNAFFFLSRRGHLLLHAKRNAGVMVVLLIFFLTIFPRCERDLENIFTSKNEEDLITV